MTWIVILPTVTGPDMKFFKEFNSKEQLTKWLTATTRDITQCSIYEAKEKLLVITIQDKPEDEEDVNSS